MKYLAALTLSITLILSGCFGSTPDAKENTNPVASETNAVDVKNTSIKIAQTKEEKLYIQDHSCFSDDCYTYQKFHKFFTTKYPDIQTVKFHPNKVLKEDKEALNMYKEQFYVGLYFAKQIQLANGQSLFDFLTKCSKNMDSANGAELGIDKSNNMYLRLAYYPILKTVDTNRTVELSLIFERHGDTVTITSNSDWLAKDNKINPDFMLEHNVMCWH
jgi:hypothetical protein